VAVLVRLLVNAGVGLGAAVRLAAGLVHPFTVCVTVYAPAVVTVIEGVVAPVLHNNVPVNALAVNTELLQLLMTVTVGAGTLEFTGAATRLPGELVHPFTVCVTVYVPAAVTVMEVVVAPVFHNNDPVNDPAVNVELPQLFTTVTVGAETLAFSGAATPLPGELVHPFTVCVTVYAPAAVIVMEAVVAPVFHNNDPVNDPAVNVELPQLLTTVTVGAGTLALIGAAVPLPGALV